MKIVFMGTPEFAIPALEALIGSKHQVLAVYTREPKPAGRGKQLLSSPVQTIAEEHSIQVFTPKNFKNPEEIEKLKALDADIIVVVAYGLILPKAVLEAFKFGALNIHPSKLPRWRGAAPIERCIMAGDEETAICIMQMDEGLDTGDVILEEPYMIPQNMTGRELAAVLAERGAKLLIETIEQIENGKAVRKRQSEEGLTYANKIFKDEEKIDWNMSAHLVNAKIRALSPKPGAYFIFRNEKIKIITAEYDLTPVDVPIGTVIDDHMTIACKEGVIKPTLVQREGRKMVYTEAFLRGFSVPMGSDLNCSG
ncbi:methionyl-tRNA formyltransferase [endosymbiont of Acanthamoeba sp. UWC8]|uniref:methionyl-tRNA formyltransferase n=1 Tax=endosymbiont of Acanthamoeba sp. UWC8 TaxID=86106 RepID=UPI0004D13AAD|nr:methionyl-tRNA formyltransferase [endosymbiont of Acanthamoeba sp. UWC8]AIF81955.1 methionyl-tRNA formyltransferase [endosymbiont of Acanthamoeba sp. UWC8]